ncbi:YtxH domain-containing protein [Muricauda sp. JGD-17]|uniref:YtxH domain-containing protein n=1 Tax=Flagellimonas ochracea TaxID=2696472 RepID=A0A964WX45_9FLAO|nr:YtxH domain-containing protein [Allomuricauda ochracea]NAY91751.1 YtxH domain-containing protein [Allomuricauda ochracea]
MSDSSNTILGILAGTALGATLGILFAPDKGSSTRRKLVEQSNALAEDVANSTAQLKEQVVDTFSSSKDNLEDKMESLVSSASYKTEDVITALESKLKELKAKNRKLQRS